MTDRPLGRGPRPAALFLLILLAACGGGGGAPSTPSTPPPTMQPPPVTTPTPPPPLSATCGRLGLPIADGKEKCHPDTATFADQLEQAIDDVVRKNPGIFDLNDVRGAGGYRVFSQGALFTGVVAALDERELCGGLYGEELAIKNNNDFSDNFDIVTSDGHIRRGPSAYRSTCLPAAFTTPSAAPGLVSGCSLAHSVPLACSREDNKPPIFLDRVMAAIDQVGRAHPEWFDFRDVQPGTNFYRVLNVQGYTQGVVKVFLDQGLCARWDGEELNVKSSNVSSENYDILTAQGFVRLGQGAYRVTCYPAFF